MDIGAVLVYKEVWVTHFSKEKIMKTVECVSCPVENRAKYFLIPVGLLIVNIFVAIVWYPWLWATGVGLAIWLFFKIWSVKFLTAPEDIKGFNGIATVMLWCAILLGVGGFFGMKVAGLL